MFNTIDEEEIQVGDYVQNIFVPEALGIVIEILPGRRRATVDWDIVGLTGDESITTTAITSLKLIQKPVKC